MKKLLSVAIICLALTACHDTRYVFSNQFPSQPSFSGTQHFTWSGKKTTIEPVKVCGSINNVAMVEEVENSGQSWLRYLTIGIYTPVTVKVYCKQPVNNSYRPEQPK